MDRKSAGHGYGYGPGRGGGQGGLHVVKDMAQLPQSGGGGSELWMSDSQIDDFLANYTGFVARLGRNFSGYIIDDGNMPANAAACSAADKLVVQDMMENTLKRIVDLNHTCAQDAAADGWNFSCGQGSIGDSASSTMGSGWKKPSMAWARGVLHNGGVPDSKYECLRLSVAFVIAATNDLYLNMNFPHQFDALDNQDSFLADPNGFDIGHSCLGIDELDIWMIPFPDAPSWYLKIFDGDLSLPVPLASLGTKVGDAIDVTANHDGDSSADPVINPNNWTNHVINLPFNVDSGDRFGIVAEARSNRWAWHSGDEQPSPTVPAFATMYGIVDMFTVN